MQVKTSYGEAMRRKYPEQIAIAIARDLQGKYNPITLGWVMPTSHAPPMLAISVAFARHSYEAIRQAGEFVVTFPSSAMAEDALFYGTKSGRDMDKLAVCGTKTEPASEMDCVLFTDAVAKRDAPVALKQLGRLLEEGESPLPILALLDRTVGQLLIAKELRARRRRSTEAASLLGAPAWRVEQILRQSDSFGEEELSKALDTIAQIDITMKTTRVPARLLLESLVVSLCGAGPGSGRRGIEH